MMSKPADVGQLAALLEAEGISSTSAEGMARVLTKIERIKELRALLNGDAPMADVDGLPRLVCALDAPDPEPVEWEVPGLIPRAQIGAIVGPGGGGKDSIVLAMLGAKAGGYAPLDLEAFGVGDPQPVVYWSEEDSQNIVLGRLEGICRGHGWDRTKVFRNFHFNSLVGFSLDSDAWAEHLAAEIQRVGATIAFLGPLRDMTAAEENSNSDMAPVMKRIREISTITGAAVGVMHHGGKPQEGKQKINLVRGASAIRDAARWLLWVERKDPVGMLVEPLKLTVGEPMPAFLVEREIQTAMNNPGVWEKATFRYVDRHQAEKTGAEEFVLTLLAATPGLKSGEIRKAATDAKMSPTSVSAAMRSMDGILIQSESGPRNSKSWSLHPPPMQVVENGACIPASRPAYAGTTDAAKHPASPSIEGCRESSSGEGDMQVALNKNELPWDDDSLLYAETERDAIQSEGAA